MTFTWNIGNFGPKLELFLHFCSVAVNEHSLAVFANIAHNFLFFTFVRLRLTKFMLIFEHKCHDMGVIE